VKEAKQFEFTAPNFDDAAFNCIGTISISVCCCTETKERRDGDLEPKGRI
jgi:hypothetical protein